MTAKFLFLKLSPTHVFVFALDQLLFSRHIMSKDWISSSLQLLFFILVKSKAPVSRG